VRLVQRKTNQWERLDEERLLNPVEEDHFIHCPFVGIRFHSSIELKASARGFTVVTRALALGLDLARWYLFAKHVQMR
jgi:hypothetical protein